MLCATSMRVPVGRDLNLGQSPSEAKPTDTSGKCEDPLPSIFLYDQYLC